MNNSVRYGVWGFPCSALGHHPFLYQPPEPRIKQMNALQSIRITLCLCNPSSILLAKKPISFLWLLPVGNSFSKLSFLPSTTTPISNQKCHQELLNHPYTQGVAPSSGLDLGTLHHGQLETETLNHPPFLFILHPTSTEKQPSLGGTGSLVDS